VASLKVKTRALVLATRGLLAGSAIALATHGLLQLPETEVPVVELPRAVAGGGASHYIEYLAVPRHWRYIGEARLVLDSETLARLEKAQPLEIKAVKPSGLYAVYNSEGVLHILSETESALWDQGADDDELVMLLAMEYFFSDRNV